MAISFIGKFSAGAINSGALTLTLPGGMLANDLIIVCHGAGDDVDLAMPAMTTAGYTDVGTSEQYANGTVDDCNQKTWYKYHNGSDTNAVCASAGGGVNSGSSAALMVFRGVALAANGGPFWTPVVKATGTGGSGADAPTIATTPESWVVIAGTAAIAASAGTATLPTNYTTNGEAGTVGTDTVSSTTAMGYRAVPAASENPGAMVFSGGSGAGNSWAAISMTLRPAVPVVPLLMIPHLAP